VIQFQRNLRWLIVTFLILLVGFILYRGWALTQKKSQSNRVKRGEFPVLISPVLKKPLSHSLLLTGDISPLMQVDLFPKVSGYLKKVHVRLGQFVSQDQMIAEIDDTEYFLKKAVQ